MSLHMENITAPSPPFESLWDGGLDRLRGISSSPLLHDGYLYADHSVERPGVYNTFTGEHIRDHPGEIEAAKLKGIEDNKLIYSIHNLETDYATRTEDESYKSGVETIDRSSVWESNQLQVVLFDGDLYAKSPLTSQTSLKRVDIDNGEISWKKDLNNYVDFTGKFINNDWISLGDSIVGYIANSDSDVSTVCLDKSDGSLKWRRSVEYDWLKPLTSTTTGVLLQSSVPDTGEYDYNWISGDSGEIQWTKTVGQTTGTPSTNWGTDDELLYAGRNEPSQEDTFLRGYSLTNGDKQWEVNLSPESGDPSGFSKIIVTSDAVIVSVSSGNPDSFDSQSIAIDKSNGSKMWEYESRIPILPTQNGLLSINADTMKIEFAIQS